MFSLSGPIKPHFEMIVGQQVMTDISIDMSTISFSEQSKFSHNELLFNNYQRLLSGFVTLI